MFISSGQQIHQFFMPLIGVTVLIGSNCSSVQGSLNDETQAREYTNEIVAPPNEDILQPITIPMYVNVSEYPGERCNRICVSGQHRVCYFDFTLEYYHAMGGACGKCNQGVEEDCKHPQCIVGDGIEKGVMSINRQIPGPAIQVCKDDLVIVDVHNHAHGTAAALHWHGLHMRETPHMDGVPFITQCPIPFTNSFRYKFYATESGTQFYHSHSGHHKMNGQYGALIIRKPDDHLSSLYDHDLPEHYILISDWMHDYAEQKFPGLPSSTISPDSVLINGRGVFTNPKTGERTKVQPTVYNVKAGQRYRFRIINSISHACPFQLQIEEHNLTVIASDSFEVQPRVFDTLITNSGERYDFIVETNHTEGDFWIRVRGLGICSAKHIESYALLRYETNAVNLEIPPFPEYEKEYQNGIVLNHPKAVCWGEENHVCISELKSLETDQQLRDASPDYQFYLSFQNLPSSKDIIFEPGQYRHFLNPNSQLLVGAINNLSLVFPDYPPLTQPELIDETQYCDSEDWPEKCAADKLCACVHRLKIALGSIVELIIIDETQVLGRMHHPFHLHGYGFMVMNMGQHPYGVPMTLNLAKQLGRRGMLQRNILNTNPPLKDTVSIPSTGFAVVRFRASNPGFWLMHCHYEWHLSVGMGLVLQVGETTEMVKPPKDFPKCGSYVPPVESVFA